MNCKKCGVAIAEKYQYCYKCGNAFASKLQRRISGESSTEPSPVEKKDMEKMSKFLSLPKSRAIRIIAGLVIGYLGFNNGFYSVDGGQAPGYNFFSIALIILGLYLIYRGIKPKK